VTEAYLLALAVASAIFILRRPDIITNAQFWAEDGVNWYEEAYTNGIAALLRPNTGYLQTFSRVVFGIATYMPLLWAPLFANSIGVLVRALVVAFLFSGRFTWVDVGPRLIVAVYMLVMPGLDGVHANITNTHWYLGLYLLLVLIADQRQDQWWRAHDFAVLVVAGLSSPFVILAVPAYLLITLQGVADMKTFGPRNWLRELLTPFTVLFFALAAVQAASLVATARARGASPLGADVLTLAHIVVTRIFLGFLVYPNFATDLHQSDSVVILVFLVGLGIVGCVLWRGPWQVRMALLFAIVTFAAALASPRIGGSDGGWPKLTTTGDRYFVIPKIAWMTALVAFGTLVSRGSRIAQKYSFVVAGVVVILCLRSFHIARLPDENFPAQVAAFDNAPPGTVVTFSILPPGWKMVLTKR
jgi:hypothetical protein